MESGNGIIGKSDKINTIDAGEIIGGKFNSFPEPLIEGNYNIILNYCINVIIVA